ncbi:hydrogenase nickel incorporation protein HypB [Desulfothermus sp.]
MKIPVIRKILEKNEERATELRERFDKNNTLVLNLISSPGAGKTTLLVRTLSALKDQFNMGVIEGDIQTTADAERIAQTGVQTVQINTEGACHLDSNMIYAATQKMDLGGLDILFVENVGNLVCPAEFKVGEDFKIALLSIPEGDDKPEKYPLLFSEAKVLLLNKIDLLPYLDFDVEKVKRVVKTLNKDIEIFMVSAKTGQGFDEWLTWLKNRVLEKKQGK